MSFRIASDWHLGTRSPPAHARLAAAFLAGARADGATVILNGDAFDDLFDGPAARAAHPGVVAELGRLAAAGRLLATAGNHDPDAGPDRLVLDVPGAGRVLVAHGHLLDPLNRSAVGQLGDGIARRLGRHRAVRAAAALAEASARALAGEAMVRVFRTRCVAAVARERCALGVFGHVHRAHAAAGDPYANAGSLRGDVLEWLALGEGGARLERLALADLPPLTSADPGGDASRGIPGRSGW